VAGLGGTRTSGRRRAGTAPAGARRPLALDPGEVFDPVETTETIRRPSLRSEAGHRPPAAGPRDVSAGQYRRPEPAAVPPPRPVLGRAAARAQARAARRGPWFVREFLLTAALVGVVVAMMMIVVESRWRQGLSGLGAVLLALAVARLVLPARAVGMLAVRGRLFDTVTLLVLGAGVIGLMLEVPLPVTR
jgi:hypothetical protein